MCGIPLAHQRLRDELATENVDVGVKNTPVIINFGSFHTVQSVDVDFRSELYSLKDTYFRTAESLENERTTSEIVILIDEKSTVLIGYVELCFDELLL